MVKNRSSRNTKEMTLEQVTNELFTMIRSCYNKGPDGIKLIILDSCMKIILDSLDKESDLKQLKNVFDNITSGNNGL